jgi:hypothetical protein
MDQSDRAAVAAQLGREPRAMRAVAHRCPCGNPDVVETSPFLDDGTPFPTLYYLTCPKAASLIGTLEASGLMRDMTERIATDTPVAALYEEAHRSYLARRDALGVLPKRVTAGGMPHRVKCLHALVGHELADPGSNPFGAEALELLPEWWADGPCVPRPAGQDAS